MTPAGAGGRHRHPHPAGGLCRPCPRRCRMLFRALPMELNLDAAVLVGMHFSALRPGIAAGWPHHGGGLHAQTGGLGVSGAGISRGQRNAAALAWMAALNGAASASVPALRQIPRQIVARLKALAGDNKLAFLLRVILMRGWSSRRNHSPGSKAAQPRAAAEGLACKSLAVAAARRSGPVAPRPRRNTGPAHRNGPGCFARPDQTGPAPPGWLPALLGEHRLVIVTGQRAGAGDNRRAASQPVRPSSVASLRWKRTRCSGEAGKAWASSKMASSTRGPSSSRWRKRQA